LSPLAIIGGGSWGTALSVVLSGRFSRIRLWVYEAELAERMANIRQNDVFLPGIPLPENVEPLNDLEAALTGAGTILTVMPSQHVRRIAEAMLPMLKPGTVFVSATKGIESGTLLRVSQVLNQVIGRKFPPQLAVLSGPTFAKEVALGRPAAVVVASEDNLLAQNVQRAFSGPSFRLYTNQDPVGVEVGAALKNVIAIGAGVCQGLSLGSNALAALICRGLAEITRLAVAAGGEPKTLAGLAGLGDLVLTCTGDLSRNRKVGMELACGKTLPEVLASMRMVAEGIETTHAAVALGRTFQVSLPITEQMEAILSGSRTPREALLALMERHLTGE
jgi:glycerol-3-phosphate dehydrogenase (NAD(P)+)